MTSVIARIPVHNGVQWQACEPTAGDFRRLTAAVHDIAGISLNETKRALVTHRVSPRVRALGYTTFAEWKKLHQR